MKEIKVMTNKIGKGVQVEMIEDGLKPLQTIVDGIISIPFCGNKLGELGIDVIINDEGKLMDLDPTYVMVHDGEMVDVIAGNVIFASNDKHGNTTSLNKKQIDFLEEMHNNKGYVQSGLKVYEVVVIEL